MFSQLLSLEQYCELLVTLWKIHQLYLLLWQWKVNLPYLQEACSSKSKENCERLKHSWDMRSNNSEIKRTLFFSNKFENTNKTAPQGCSSSVKTCQKHDLLKLFPSVNVANSTLVAIFVRSLNLTASRHLVSIPR